MSEEFHIPMVPPEKPAADGICLWQSPGSIYLWVVRSLLAVAIGIAVYLSIQAIADSGVIGCDGGSECDDVLQSKWSKWFGLPVSFFAVATYGSMLIATFFISSKIPQPVAKLAWALLLAFSAVSCLSALWFIGLQAALLHQYCKFCLTTHSVMFVCTILLWVKAPFIWRIGGRTPEDSDIAISLELLCLVVAIGLFGTGSLALGQWYAEQEDNSVVEQPDEIVSNPKPMFPKDPSKVDPTKDENGNQKLKPLKPRVVPFFGGKISLDITQYPMIGSPDAKQVILKLFDYTCVHCRDRHRQLEKIRKLCDDDLTIVLVPVPLNSGCNPHIHGLAHTSHIFACQYARAGLIVWLANREKFAEYHQRMFQGAEPPSYSDTKKLARKLIGEKAYDYNDKNARSKLKECVEIYHQATKTGQRGLPLILTTKAKVAGKSSAKSLIKKLRKAGVDIPEE